MTQLPAFDSRTRYGIILVAAGLLVYVFIRSMLIPVTHDEAATFFHYVTNGRILPGVAHWDANNHILNSFLVKTSVELFGESVWALRLPNVLGFLVFLVVTYNISRFTSNRMQRLILLSGLWFLHIQLEFFGLARGYGLAITFGSAAMLSMILLIQNPKILIFLAMAVAGSLTVLSNLTWLPTILLIFLLSVILYSVPLFQRKKKLSVYDAFLIPIIAGFIFLMRYMYQFGADMEERGLLYYGTDDFVGVSIGSLVKISFGFESLLLSWIIAVTGIILILATGYQFITRPHKVLSEPGFLVSVVFAGAVASVFMMHLYRDVLYPEDRTGMHLILLFIFCAGMLPVFIWKKVYILSLLLPVFMILSVYNFRFDTSVVWREEHLTEDIYTAFAENVSDIAGTPIVGGYHLRRLTWAWQMRHHPVKGSVIHFGPTARPFTSPDFLLVHPRDMQEQIFREKYKLLFHETVSQISIYKRDPIMQRHTLLDTTIGDVVGNQEFYTIFNENRPQWHGKILAVEFSADVRYRRNHDFQVVLAGLSDKQEIEYYIDMPLKWIYMPDGSHQKVNNVLYRDTLTADAPVLKVYIWNLFRQQIDIRNLNARIVELKEPAVH